MVVNSWPPLANVKKMSCPRLNFLPTIGVNYSSLNSVARHRTGAISPEGIIWASALSEVEVLLRYE
jgi:hypothetical protein